MQFQLFAGTFWKVLQASNPEFSYISQNTLKLIYLNIKYPRLCAEFNRVQVGFPNNCILFLFTFLHNRRYFFESGLFFKSGICLQFLTACLAKFQQKKQKTKHPHQTMVLQQNHLEYFSLNVTDSGHYLQTRYVWINTQILILLTTPKEMLHKFNIQANIYTCIFFLCVAPCPFSRTCSFSEWMIGMVMNVVQFQFV